MRLFPLLLILMVGIAACNDDAGQPETQPIDSTAISSVDSGATGSSDTAASYVMSDFEHAAFAAYARAGVAVSPEVTDSLFKATADKTKIPEEMEKLMKRHDSLARRTVADYYKITVDSLNRIIEKGNREKW